MYIYKMASKWKLYLMITFLFIVILAIGVISVYFVFVVPPESSDSNDIEGDESSIELFKYLEENF